ncbi:hypothetical protein F5Y16DRAFT_20388 [Xylariaceae sp. FL0255]|nr:hypothetical protein F5Y16DRAFT_20388 [Xylariaceae sp. FL0255]
MADVASAPAAPAAPAKKPERPNVDLFNEQVAKAEKEYQASMAKYNAIKAKVELALPNKNKDAPTPTQKRRQELIAQANEIRTKQGVGKNARTSKLDQIKRLDEQLRSRIAEQKAARGKVNFKSAEDLDREIDRLEKQVNGGMMKLVDEKKALTEISNLRKQRKNFAQFDSSQKGIDDLKAKIKEIKDSMDEPEAKALSEQYNKIQAELDTIKAEQDEAFKNLNSLRDERTKLQAEQQEKFQAVRKIKDEYYAAKKAFNEYDRAAKQARIEKRKAEDKRWADEQQEIKDREELEKAKEAAFLDEINCAESLLRFLDPASVSAEKAPLLADSGMTAQASRKVDDSGLKGTKLVRKEDRDDDYLPAVKKGKKGKKNGAAAVEKTGAFSCPPQVMKQCGDIGVDPPMSAADVPALIEKIKEKLDFWKANQKTQTQRNIEEAEKKLKARKAGEATNDVNGDEKADTNLEAVTSELKDASLEEKKE